MAVSFNNPQNANTIAAPPRIVTVYDNVGGCPGTRTSPIITATITVTNPSYFWIFSKFIRNVSGRTDLQGYVQGPAGSNYASNTLITRRLNWTGAGTWDHVVMDFGVFGNIPGTYTFGIYADSPSSWGCGRNHGGMSVLALETA